MKGRVGTLCVIDASPSGVSGDKYLGALIDLGGKLEALRRVARTIAEVLPGTKSIDVTSRSVERGELAAKLVTVKSEEDADGRKAATILSAARKCTAMLGLSEWGSRFTISTIQTLMEAESKVHGRRKSEVEVHELGSADTLVDVLGVAYLTESLALSNVQWLCSPVAVGGGTTRFSGRTYPNPPPAVAEILKSHSFPMVRGSSETELSTPTGVAITVNLVTRYSFGYPAMSISSIGYGAGSKELDEVSNVLRLTVGQSLDGSHSHDEVVILETNLDDVSGEVIGHAVERLMASGAKDVTVTPALMKKNRPGQIMSVISSAGKADELASTLMEETGTLGVREIPVRRHIANREIATIELKLEGRAYNIRVKVSKGKGGRVLRAKPEYEDLKKIASKTGISLSSLASRAQEIAEKSLSTSAK